MRWLIAAALLVLSASAHAAEPQMPKRYLGTWCLDLGSPDANHSPSQTIYKRSCPKGAEAPTLITVRPNGFVQHYEDDCRLTAIRIAVPGKPWKGWDANFICHHGNHDFPTALWIGSYGPDDLTMEKP